MRTASGLVTAIAVLALAAAASAQADGRSADAGEADPPDRRTPDVRRPTGAAVGERAQRLDRPERARELDALRRRQGASGLDARREALEDGACPDGPLPGAGCEKREAEDAARGGRTGRRTGPTAPLGPEDRRPRRPRPGEGADRSRPATSIGDAGGASVGGAAGVRDFGRGRAESGSRQPDVSKTPEPGGPVPIPYPVDAGRPDPRGPGTGGGPGGDCLTLGIRCDVARERGDKPIDRLRERHPDRERDPISPQEAFEQVGQPVPAPGRATGGRDVGDRAGEAGLSPACEGGVPCAADGMQRDAPDAAGTAVEGVRDGRGIGGSTPACGGAARPCGAGKSAPSGAVRRGVNR
ncbi:MAG: hypothetical protein R3263_05335 [Myxococcota bacterium]|nr:hypothetical protein [Myxococcota bacterium]